jgi:hypothetical protein
MAEDKKDPPKQTPPRDPRPTDTGGVSVRDGDPKARKSR